MKHIECMGKTGRRCSFVVVFFFFRHPACSLGYSRTIGLVLSFSPIIIMPIVGRIFVTVLCSYLFGFPGGWCCTK